MRTHIKLSSCSLPTLQWFFRPLFFFFILNTIELCKTVCLFSCAQAECSQAVCVWTWCFCTSADQCCSLWIESVWQPITTGSIHTFFSNSMWWLSSLCHILVIIPLSHRSLPSSATLSTWLPLWNCCFDQLLMILFYCNSFRASWAVSKWGMNLTDKYSLDSNCITNHLCLILPPFCRPQSSLR